MDGTVLRTFIEVVESGSLIAAARRLNVTQSTVTARINSLEQEIGQKLIHRNKSGTELTSAGFKLKRYAEVMLQLWRQARFETSLPKGFTNVCNIGCEVDLWQGLGAKLVDHLTTHEPGVALAAWPGEQRAIDRWLSIGLVDVALCFNPQPDANFATYLLFEDELVLVARARDAANPRRVGIRQSGYIYVDHGDEFRRQHAVAFPGDETPAITLASADWALDHLLRHGGSGYLTARHASAALRTGKLTLIDDAPRFHHRIYLVANQQTVQNWAWFDRAVAMLRKQAADLPNITSKPVAGTKRVKKSSARARSEDTPSSIPKGRANNGRKGI